MLPSVQDPRLYEPDSYLWQGLCPKPTRTGSTALLTSDDQRSHFRFGRPSIALWKVDPIWTAPIEPERSLTAQRESVRPS